MGCESQVDPDDNELVWIASPDNNEFVVFQNNASISVDQAFEIMKNFRVFDRFLSGIGFKINRPLGNERPS